MGFPWAPMSPQGRTGVPRGPQGSPMGLPWAYSTILSKLEVQFQAIGSQVRSLRTESSLAEFIRGIPGIRGVPGIRGIRGSPAIRPKWDLARSSQPPFTRAGGQDDVTSNKLPQIISHYIISYIEYHI